MSRERAGEKKNLKHEIKTRVNDQKFRELSDLLSKTSCHTMSELVRNILYNRQVKVFTVDENFSSANGGTECYQKGAKKPSA